MSRPGLATRLEKRNQRKTTLPTKATAWLFSLQEKGNPSRRFEEVYLTIFEHTTDLLERQQLAQRICDLVALRPRLDLQDNSGGNRGGVRLCAGFFEARYLFRLCSIKEALQGKSQPLWGAPILTHSRFRLLSACEEAGFELAQVRLKPGGRGHVETILWTDEILVYTYIGLL